MRKVVALALSLEFLASCQTQQVLSRDDLIQRGTRVFKGVELQKSIEASVSALKKLGFEVTKKNSVSRAALIKTSSHEISNRLFSWSILLFTDGHDVEIQARPQAYLKGVEVSQENFSKEMIDPRFRDLWQEIEANL